jgi:thiol-disulfide isomerase/thioredoxin
LQLRTEKQTLPHQVAGRLPESIMPLKTQLLATEEQKRLAFTSFCGPNHNRYCGYTTRSKAPVYLLNSTSYPFQRMDSTTVDVTSKENVWNTFHYLPTPLVPKDDKGILSAAAASSEMPKFDVPLEVNFFNNSLGSQLLMGQNNTLLHVSEALHNARLIGLYFSAHWCGPCRTFTPMLAEMYEHLKDVRPTHGLEIVFVSADRDANSFQRYFGSMPWQAIPFDQLQLVKKQLNEMYGVRGIPSFVVLDAVSGQVVVPAKESRQAVAMACRGGELQIEAMLDSWLERTPQESREMLSMLELSCQDEEAEEADEKENPYLVGGETKPVDTAARIKEFFGKLVAEGSDPTAAAAKAIGLIAEEQKSGPKLEAGPLTGKAIRAGPALSDEDTLDQAFARALDWNSPSIVADVLSTALKYLKNTTKEPWSPKFRTFKLSNKVADQVTRAEGCLGLLQGLGFEVFGTSQDFKATIPVAADLEAMNETITRLLEGLEEK